jgi:hypothetical protein
MAGNQLQGGRKNLLFVNKKKQKNFIRLQAARQVSHGGHAGGG